MLFIVQEHYLSLYLEKLKAIGQHIINLAVVYLGKTSFYLLFQCANKVFQLIVIWLMSWSRMNRL